MYLESRHRESALMRMAALLSPDGLLILDPAKYPGKAEHLFGKGNKGIYTLRGLIRDVVVVDVGDVSAFSRPTPPQHRVTGA